MGSITVSGHTVHSTAIICMNSYNNESLVVRRPAIIDKPRSECTQREVQTIATRAQDGPFGAVGPRVRSPGPPSSASGAPVRSERLDSNGIREYKVFSSSDHPDLLSGGSESSRTHAAAWPQPIDPMELNPPFSAVPSDPSFRARPTPPTGRVFNLMRYATHDGPGIRTTVFLKGCPLSCWWCHNPENWNHVPSEVYLAERCTGCGECMEACPESALSRTPRGVAADPARCRHCGRCVAACPAGARESTVRQAGVADLVKEIASDIPFYEQSGGGVTFSGGEPLAQPEFLMALLEQCGRLEIHRAVDTSGYADPQVLLEAARRTRALPLRPENRRPRPASRRHRGRQRPDPGEPEAALRHADGHHHTDPGDPGRERRRGERGGLRRFHRRPAPPPPREPAALPPHGGRQVQKTRPCHPGEQTQPPSGERVAEIARGLAEFGLAVTVGG